MVWKCRFCEKEMPDDKFKTCVVTGAVCVPKEQDNTNNKE